MSQGDEETIPVGLVPCPGYDPEQVLSAVTEAIDLTGGIGRYLTAGMHVLVKPNILMGAAPEKAVCTHPEVLKAVCLIITGYGCTVTIADSPGAGIPYRERNLIRAYDSAGYSVLAGLPGVTLNKDTSSRTVSFPEGALVKQFEIITPVLDADAVVVVSKLKTHMYTGMTGATKNLFGAIPGLDKPPYHARLRDDHLFGKMLLDLNRCIRPVLQVMDAVDIMEGDGPMAGTPVHLGAVLAGPDFLAMDVAACRLIGFDPLTIGSISEAVQQGAFDPRRVEIRGAAIKDLEKPGIKKPETHGEESSSPVRSFFRGILHRLGKSYTLHPSLVKSSCTRCYKCERICPIGAITVHQGYPRFSHKACIRCYCCHEMCDSHAIRLRPGILYRVLRPLIR
jgi:uncharacterized protein (DUF362 family)/NAD-dependent dihydropyrimidine dehydrogenase PreA subunit